MRQNSRRRRQSRLIDLDTLTVTPDRITGSLEDGTPFTVPTNDPLWVSMIVHGANLATRTRDARVAARAGGKRRGEQLKAKAEPGLREVRARYLQMKARNPRLGEQVAADRLGTSRGRLRKALGKAP
jgi:hypothetical protein